MKKNGTKMSAFAPFWRGEEDLNRVDKKNLTNFFLTEMSILKPKTT